MRDEKQAMLQILHENHGFDRPEAWLEFALHHSFRRVKARAIVRCPDCEGSPCRTLGQYVYYSTLMKLLECKECQLVWSDAHIDRAEVQGHFDRAYKDRDYFLASRASIFRDLVSHVSRLAPPSGRVLDIGGAQGDLMYMLGRSRPDLKVVVHDLSGVATAFAQREFGLEVITGSIGDLSGTVEPFDVVVLSDTLYYEPELHAFWQILPKLLRPRASLVLRVPNKLRLIRTSQAFRQILRFGRKEVMQDRIMFHNPEHIYVFSQGYLFGRMLNVGFGSAKAYLSPLLHSGTAGWRGRFASIAFGLAQAAHALTGGRAAWSPSLVVIAQGFEHGRTPSSD